MARILTPEEVQKVVSVLGQELAASPTSSSTRPVVYYAMKHYLEGKLYLKHVFTVDKWPDFTAILAQSGGKSEMESNIFHWTEESGLRMLLQDSVVDWEKRFFVSAPRGVAMLQEVCEEKGMTATVYPVVTVFYPHKVPPELDDTDDDVTVSPARPEQSQWVNQMRSRGGSGDEDCSLIRHLITTFISSCAYDKHGNPLAFAVMTSLGTASFGFTVPQHRRKGYAKLVVQYYIQKCLEAGYMPFCCIESNNEVSKKVAKKLGCTWDERGNFVIARVSK